jgi:cell division protein FtsZ
MREIIESMDRADRDHKSGLDKVMVLGLGGCGSNTVAHLANYGLKGPKLIAANSDLQALDLCPAPHKIVLGPKCAGGTGCGGDPAMGAKAAEESMETILEELKGAQIVFITAGMGGGTGTGASPVVAKALSELPDPPLLVAVILLPFGYEAKRLRMGKQVLVQLSRYCKSVIPVYNDQLVKCFPKARTVECLRIADDILLRAVASVTDLIQYPGYVNVDMKDVKSVLGHSGQAIMGCGEAAGDDRVEQALKMAVNSPLMADATVAGAKAALVNITSDDDILMGETASINDAISKAVGSDCNFIWGMAVDNTLKESGLMKVTVIATGLPLDESLRELEPIVLEPELEPDIVLKPEPAITLAAPIVSPAPPEPEPEPMPEPELKQVVKRRVIKLGGGGSSRSRLDNLKDDGGDSLNFMRNRQD